MSKAGLFFLGLWIGLIGANGCTAYSAYSAGARVCVGWEPYLETRCFERERERLPHRQRTTDGEPDEAETH